MAYLMQDNGVGGRHARAVDARHKRCPAFDCLSLNPGIFLLILLLGERVKGVCDVRERTKKATDVGRRIEASQ